MGCGCGGQQAGTPAKKWKWRTTGGATSNDTYGTKQDALIALSRTGQTGEPFEVPAQ